jgi:acyl-CoA dehydrogenase
MVDHKESEQLIQQQVSEICDDFDMEYWRSVESEARFPKEFYETVHEHGFVAANVPEEMGGGGLNTSELSVLLETVAKSGGGWNATNTLHGSYFTTAQILENGTEEQREWIIPEIVEGEKRFLAFALTEPNTGTESTKMETFAEKRGDEYVINDEKTWISRVDISDYLLLVARTSRYDEVDRPVDGISMFIVDLDEASDAIELQEIPKMTRNGNHSYQVFIRDLHIPAENLIGEEGGGFYNMLDLLNSERILTAAEGLGIGQCALDLGVQYAKEREVYDRPIGKNQAIQHPLAASSFAYDSARGCWMAWFLPMGLS